LRHLSRIEVGQMTRSTLMMIMIMLVFVVLLKANNYRYLPEFLTLIKLQFHHFHSRKASLFH
jgi:hypothetical protein